MQKMYYRSVWHTFTSLPSFQHTPHPLRLPCIFNQEAPFSEDFLHGLDDPLKGAFGTLLLREACESQIRLAAAFQHREGFDRE